MWTCNDCDQEGQSFTAKCPVCGSNDLTMTEAGWRMAIDSYQAIHRRAKQICALLEFGCDRLDFSNADTFETTWEEPNCRCGCSGYSTHTRDIPTRYLWMSDTDIEADVQAQKDAEQKAKLEAEQKAKLQEAQAKLEWAKARAATAQADAELALAKAQADIAALQGGA